MTKEVKQEQYSLKCFYEDEPKCNIVALYGDGSGANIFQYRDKGFYGLDLDEPVDFHWFIDSGYLWWMPLPDNFKFWFQDEQ